MKLIPSLQTSIQKALESLYNLQAEASQLVLSPTRKDFSGDYTLVVFPFTKAAKKKPEVIAAEIGEKLQADEPLVKGYNVIKGFLNLEVDTNYWLSFLETQVGNKEFGKQAANGEKVMVEYCSPNTNKPLHLGHIRNILLGWSCAQILEFAGYDVVKTQIINDRGIHICKSMIAWMETGEGETPESAGIKGDHLVGKYYVRYNDLEKKEKEAMAAEGKEGDTAILTRARDLLMKWENKDPEVRGIWEKMNGWVYAGFDQTFEAIGVTFDKLYYESNTYLLGKQYIDEGLANELFYKKEDGSVWIDLEDAGMDQKLVLRADGTSVYMTQDIGTAQSRFEDFQMGKLVYVVGDEQNYHFKVLFEIMKRFGASYADGLYHLSYGMVDLPTGKMKSREGTVVDADELIKDVIGEVASNAQERGSLVDTNNEDQQEIFRKIGLGALKYFILKVNPKKRMTFDPKESVDLQGDTGPYIQNAYVRIQSVFRKAGELESSQGFDGYQPEALEMDLIKMLYQFPEVINTAAKGYDPSAVASYCFDLAKTYHRFYNEFNILKVEEAHAKSFRLTLSKMVGNVLESGMNLLGIEMPDKM